MACSCGPPPQLPVASASPWSTATSTPPSIATTSCTWSRATCSSTSSPSRPAAPPSRAIRPSGVRRAPVYDRAKPRSGGGMHMRRIGLAILAMAALGASHASAQASNDSMLLELGAGQLSEAQRQVTQLNIDRASRALRDKDYAQARKYAQPVTRADPKRIEAWLLLGAAQLGLEDWGKARTAYTTALRITPGHPEAR